LFVAAAELMAQQTPYRQLQLVDFGLAPLHRIPQDRVLQLGPGDRYNELIEPTAGAGCKFASSLSTAVITSLSLILSMQTGLAYIHLS